MVTQETAVQKCFFSRARTRSLTRWGGIFILFAFTLLVINLLGDEVKPDAEVAEAVWRSRVSEGIQKHPEFSYYEGNGRNVFVFKELPKPEPVAEPVEVVAVVPEPEPVLPTPPTPTVDTSGLVLSGVVADARGNGWAIVDGAGKDSLVVRTGDKLRGATVERIEPTRLLLRKDDVTGVLTLRESFQEFAGKPVEKTEEVKSAGKNVSEDSVPKRRRKLGISVRAVSGKPGMLVTRVNRDDINVRTGDRLLAIDGEQVNTMSAAVEKIRSLDSKSSVSLQLQRDGRTFDIQVPLEE